MAQVFVVEVVLYELPTVRQWIFGLFIGMMAGFMLGLATLLGGEGVATCGCFGAFSVGLWLEATVLRNLRMLVLVSFLLYDIDCS